MSKEKNKKKLEQETCDCHENCECEDGCECNDECKCDEECSCNEISNGFEEKVKKLEEALLRNQAELLNFKRRKEEETSRLLKYAEEDIILGFLPILDNFERAIKMDDNNLEDEVSKFLEGFKMVYTQIKTLLEKFEVKEIETLHKSFDPTYHQAVLTDRDENFESGVVLDVLQKGYTYKDKVLRPSMVKVNE